jgi:23S rRNA pseudouridine1911/1915/1917 synthase
MKASRGPARSLSLGAGLLYEDRDILVVHKPAGLLSIASGGERDRTLYWVLSEYLRKKGERRRAAVVHRLDRETSGLVLFAKSEGIKRRFMEHWKDLVLERRYVALAEGEMPDREGLIDAPLGEDRGGRVIVDGRGKAALTRWKLMASGGGYALLELELETGRRNQIRVHLSHIGHPVAGDKKYGARGDPLGRLALHASRLSFTHPVSGKLMEFEYPEPRRFRSVCAQKEERP